MHLIIGGAFQGKRAYAAARFGLAPEDILECTSHNEPHGSRRCLAHFERYLRFCADRGMTPNTDFSEDTVILCEDIFCGIVSTDPRERAWRELAGRTVTAMAAKATSVTRLFCGIPIMLK